MHHQKRREIPSAGGRLRGRESRARFPGKNGLADAAANLRGQTENEEHKSAGGCTQTARARSQAQRLTSNFPAQKDFRSLWRRMSIFRSGYK